MWWSRWTARTRGCSAWPRAIGATASAPRASERARNPRKQGPGTGVRILSIGGSRPLPAKDGPATLESRVHRPLALILALVSAALVAPNAFGSGSTAASTVDL